MDKIKRRAMLCCAGFLALALLLTGMPYSAASDAYDPLGKIEPNVTVRVAMNMSPHIKHPQGESLESNRWIDLYKEALGIDVVYDWVTTNGEEYNQKLNVNIASNSVPDIFHVGPEVLRQLNEAGLIANLDEAYNYLHPGLLSYLEAEPITLKAASYQGNLMALPDPVIAYYSPVWVRESWLNKFDLSLPTTMDELVHMLTLFRNEDPDGNGVKDTFGMPVSSGMWGWSLYLENFFAGYEAYPTIWVKDGDKLAFGATMPENKLALAALQQMYKDGLIDREFVVKNGATVEKEINDGKYGFMYQSPSGAIILKDFKTNYPDEDMIPFALPSVSGQPAKSVANLRPSMYWVVSSSYANPEVLIKLANIRFHKLNDPEHADPRFIVDEEGNEVDLCGVRIEFNPPSKNVVSYTVIEDLIAGGGTDLSVLNEEQKVWWQYIQAFQDNPTDSVAWGYYRAFAPGGSFGVSREYRDNIQYDEFYGAPGKLMTANWSTLIALRDEVFTNIIIGAKSVDEFDQFVDEWNKMGGKDVTDEVNLWYAEQ